MVRVRLDFATKQLDINGDLLGRFVPASTTEGTVELSGTTHKYVIHPRPYGEQITLDRAGHAVAIRETNYHHGVWELRVGDDITFELTMEHTLVAADGVAGHVAWTPTDVTMEFTSRVPTEWLAVVAAIVALDTMWANLVGFTRSPPPPAVRGSGKVNS